MEGGSAVSPLRHQCHTTDEDQRGNHSDRGGQTGVDGHVCGGRREHSSDPHKYARKGHVIVCGYDKAETFLEVFGDDDGRKTPVVFFDDERVNIDNFSPIVDNCTCYHFVEK
jgi:hypothetical protein